MTAMLAGLADHLWQSTAFLAAISLLAVLVRHQFALLRLWMWRIAALKFLLPFALLYRLGAWMGFSVPYPDHGPPGEIVAALAALTPLASPARVHAWGLPQTLTALTIAVPVVAVCAHWLRQRMRIERERVQAEDARRELDVDDVLPRPGFWCSVLLTTFVAAAVGLPTLSGAVDDRLERLSKLKANSAALLDAPVDMTKAAPGMGGRYRVAADTRGVVIRNVSIHDLVAIAYGIGRSEVINPQMISSDDPAPQSWIASPRYDVRVSAAVPEPEDFDAHALRRSVTRYLAERFGLELYLNGKCQPPCGRRGLSMVEDLSLTAASSPVRKQLLHFLAAFNTGDLVALQKFAALGISPRYPDSPRFEEALYMHKQTGGIDVLEITEPAPDRLKGWFRARDAEAIMAFTFDVEPSAPHRMLDFRVEWKTPPAKYRRPRLPEAVAIRALYAEAVYREMTEKFSGAVLVKRGGKVLLRKAYGLADRDLDIPNTIDTRFRTASVTKMFTAVAVLRLVQDRRIKLDDPIGKWLPAVSGKPIARATIHQLLTHTSGAGDVFGPRYTEHRRELRTHADYVKMFGGDVLRSEPGTRYEYSNLGYILLGAMIERVTRRSYYDYVQEVVFEPAGMWHTGSLPEDVEVEGRAIGYDRPPGTRDRISAMPFLDYRGLAACGAYSTVDDLARFIDAVRANRLLNEKYTRLLLEPKQQIMEGRSYAYGFTIEDPPGEEHWIGHNGNDHGMNAEVWFSPETDYAVIVLSNFDPPAATQLAHFATARLPLTHQRDPRLPAMEAVAPLATIVP
jgi:D-alanyl-D-alanine carboxypeptidase